MIAGTVCIEGFNFFWGGVVVVKDVLLAEGTKPCPFLRIEFEPILAARFRHVLGGGHLLGDFDFE